MPSKVRLFKRLLTCSFRWGRRNNSPPLNPFLWLKDAQANGVNNSTLIFIVMWNFVSDGDVVVCNISKTLLNVNSCKVVRASTDQANCCQRLFLFHNLTESTTISV